MTTAWVDQRRPGHLGRRRDGVHAAWDEQYGPTGWRLRWRVGPGLHAQPGALALYEDAYFALLSTTPDLLTALESTARDVYDLEEGDTESALDYSAQRGVSTHLQDIAVRRVLVRLGRWFAGDDCIRLRAPADGVGPNTVGAVLDSGRVPFHRPDLLLRPELTGWWRPGSVESFYQSNKVLQCRASPGTAE